MRIRFQLRLWLFSTMVLLLMITALVYSYPGGLKDAIEMSELAISYFQQ